MSTTDEIMDLASEWAQETKDFGHLDESRPRDALLKAVEALAADAARYRWLREAAQAVIDRWDTPLWKDVPATAEYIGRLRAALGEKP
jgi:hypothetical protein